MLLYRAGNAIRIGNGIRIGNAIRISNDIRMGNATRISNAELKWRPGRDSELLITLYITNLV